MLSFLPRTWPSWQLLDLALTLAASIPLFLNHTFKIDARMLAFSFFSEAQKTAKDK